MKLLRPLLPLERFTAHDRAVALVMWMVGVVQGFAQAHPTAGLPFTRQGLGVSEADMSALLAVARLASLGAIALSVWGDRKGRRRPLLVAYTLLVLATASSGLATAPWHFGVSQSLVRIAVSALSSLGVVWLAEHLAPHVRAYGVAIYGAAGSFGAAIAIVGLPLAERDWRFPYALTLLGLLLLPVLVRRLEESPLVRSTAPTTKVLSGLVAVTSLRWFYLAGIAGLFPSAFLAVGLAFTTERMVGDLGLSTGTAILVTLGGGTIGGVGFFLGGRLSDSWGRRPTTVLALIAILAGGLGIYHFEATWMLVAAIVVSSFGSFAYIPAASTHRAELFPTESRATAAASLHWIGTVGSAIGLGLGRFLIEGLGLTGTLDVLGIGVLVAAVLTLFLPETKGKLLEG
ncbi:MAG TPA: MFS transporter [Acidimicrobiia bacterium]|nr:MFS transporter [Acidimicrobiia bacterium]